MHSKNPQKSLPRLQLPGDIIEEILSRQPVKSLLRFRCVSKSWLSLITSNRFIKIHLQNSSKDNSFAHQRLVFNDNAHRALLSVCSLHSLFNSPSKEGSSSSSPSPSPSPIIITNPINNLPEKGKYVGSCNGVLCLVISDNFSLLNPATRVFIKLPKLPGSISSKIGFGWDESSGAFKVFAYLYDFEQRSRSGHVYSSKTNSWKTVAMGSPACFCTVGLFVCGRLHWVVCKGSGDDDRKLYAIESFNLENDEVDDIRIELPPFDATAYASDTFLGEIRGCLCTIFENYVNRVDIWFMKEYGVKDSWFKLLTFPFAASDHTIYPVIRHLHGEGPNEEIFIIYGRSFVICSAKDNDVSSISSNMDIINFYRAGVYVESLVSPSGVQV